MPLCRRDRCETALRSPYPLDVRIAGLFSAERGGPRDRVASVAGVPAA